MRYLVIWTHPTPDSHTGRVAASVLSTLRDLKADVDELDLYRTEFDPVMREADYHAFHQRTFAADLAPYVERIKAADVIVIVHPIWNFGPPALMKGFIDRVFRPGVAFEMNPIRGALEKLRGIVVVTSYGAPKLGAFFLGDPPRRYYTRVFPHLATRRVKTLYIARHGMKPPDRAVTPAETTFLSRVTQRLQGLHAALNAKVRS